MGIRSCHAWFRTLIAASVVVAAANIKSVDVSAPAATSSTVSETAPFQPKILVLGAGMSGVMTATTLFENGFTDVTIIEANDYIGGRIKAGSMAGRPIEYGANWIHGTVENPIFDLAVSKKLNLVETLRESCATLPKGIASTSPPGAEKAFEAAFIKAEERAARYLNLGKKDLTVTDALRYEGWSAKTAYDHALLQSKFDLEVGPSDETSFELGMNIPTYAKDARDMLVADSKGYNSLVFDQLAKYFPTPLNNKRVLLNTLVNRIEYNEEGVAVTATDRNSGAVSTYTADFVVTTFSVGVLRNKAPELFVPALPEDKLDAIYSVRMTLFLKVFVEVTEKFWADETDNAETWMYADNVAGNFTSWVDLSVPKLGETFANPKNSSYLAVAMIAGYIAERAQNLSPDDLKIEVVRVLRGMFPKAASRITTETVANVVMKNWGTDELFSGSWANPPPGFTKADFAKLAEPVGRVYFSGEYTSAEYFGYVHGACLAGIETAKQLMKRLEGE